MATGYWRNFFQAWLEAFLCSQSFLVPKVNKIYIIQLQKRVDHWRSDIFNAFKMSLMSYRTFLWKAKRTQRCSKFSSAQPNSVEFRVTRDSEPKSTKVILTLRHVSFVKLTFWNRIILRFRERSPHSKRRRQEEYIIYKNVKCKRKLSVDRVFRFKALDYGKWLCFDMNRLHFRHATN